MAENHVACNCQSELAVDFGSDRRLCPPAIRSASEMCRGRVEGAIWSNLDGSTVAELSLLSSSRLPVDASLSIP